MEEDVKVAAIVLMALGVVLLVLARFIWDVYDSGRMILSAGLRLTAAVFFVVAGSFWLFYLLKC